MKYLVVVLFFVVCVFDHCHCAEEAVNCTKIGEATKCCQKLECDLVNCTEGDVCRSASKSASDWGAGCETAVIQVKQCQDLIAQNGSTTPVEVNTTPTEIPITATAIKTTAHAHEDPTTQTEPTTKQAPITTPETTPSELGPTHTTPSMETTTEKPSCHRKFDAASFLGGMVLMLGVLSIIFFACKYYKSKVDARYRQF